MPNSYTIVSALIFARDSGIGWVRGPTPEPTRQERRNAIIAFRTTMLLTNLSSAALSERVP